MGAIRPAMKERWWDRARCHDLWSLFDSTLAADHKKARKICKSCPVMADCLLEVVNMRNSHRPVIGTWAGMLFGARGGAGRRAAVCGTDAGYYRHIRRDKEGACPECLKAHAEAETRRKVNR